MRTSRDSRLVPILLQKSQIVRRQFFCSKKIRPTTTDSCALNRATEAVSEFLVRRCGPPHLYTKIPSKARKTFVHQCKQSFATKTALPGPHARPASTERAHPRPL